MKWDRMMFWGEITFKDEATCQKFLNGGSSFSIKDSEDVDIMRAIPYKDSKTVVLQPLCQPQFLFGTTVDFLLDNYYDILACNVMADDSFAWYVQDWVKLPTQDYMLFNCNGRVSKWNPDQDDRILLEMDDKHVAGGVDWSYYYDYEDDRYPYHVHRGFNTKAVQDELWALCDYVPKEGERFEYDKHNTFLDPPYDMADYEMNLNKEKEREKFSRICDDLDALAEEKGLAADESDIDVPEV